MKKEELKKRDMVWMVYEIIIFILPVIIGYVFISSNTSLKVGMFLILISVPLQFHAGIWGEKLKAFIDNYFF